jgi:adenosylmethionine-8-amino-7-oxononanoate aminotransferase
MLCLLINTHILNFMSHPQPSFAPHQSTKVWQRQFNKDMPIAVGGEGCWLVDAQGKRYLDASGGAAVSCLGHGHPEVLAAMHRQIDQLAYAHTSFFTTQSAEALADNLLAHAPPGMSHAYFVSGGSEGLEAALKMARQYFVEIGQPQRTKLIARKQSYHGNTLGALAVGGNEWRRAQFAPLLIDVTHLSPCYEYRDRLSTETAEQYSARLVQELEDTINKLGPTEVMAFCAETVVGATAGALTPTPGYFEGVARICKQYGVLLIIDEVMCGMGRVGSLTGSPHACTAENLVPDLMVIAKGLGGGYQPIGAVLAQKFITDAIAGGSGFFQHGHTYLGHATACAAALAVQEIMQRDQLVQRCATQGKKLKTQLQDRFAAHPYVGDVRGRGLFIGIELVQDRSKKTPFNPALKLHAHIKHVAMQHGLLCYPMGGTVDGKNGDHILLAPPFIISDDELTQLSELMHTAIDEAIAIASKTI